LKSNVAKRWLRDQGVLPQEALARDTSAERSIPLPEGQIPPRGNPLSAPKVAAAPSLPDSKAQTPTSPRPYNLDRLISERNRAEADLEDMIKEMRGKLSGR